MARTEKLEELISNDEIQDRAKELAEEIERDYQGREIVIVCVLKGAFIFTADLIRYLSLPSQVEFLAVSSYGSSTKSSGVIKIIKDLDVNIQGKDVLLVEDIVDTGLTLNYLKENLKSRGPESLKICTLLDKPDRREVDIHADYVGFVIDDYFVVGYGLDYGENYRNLRGVNLLPEEYI
ncbi:hypoxanthine phosphoribosyltransferase [Natranaerofaba carboxydovora]|uniref:hypoxanthine phosphoribosyltransferase n=1 Tax=Natranaerofaba carboxydovora TaxID=2742683 RepID=UPI001F12CD7E|nr:hypoxanthine phosphoribosyltransferase [Natranaerofaba carboxydovora]UMZ75287.1 Hypoxanthine phosphoribosyltransferase [Natranaerofaba carboxydovora]